MEFGSIRGKVIRVTALNNCGIPLPTKSVVVTKGFVSVALTNNYEDGEETTVKDADGDICIYDKSPDKIKNVSAEITLCKVNPEMDTIVTGSELVIGHAGEAIGDLLDSDADPAYFALEIWSDIPGQACGVGGAKQYLYHVFPFFTDGKVGDYTIEETAASFTLSAATKWGSGWGVGPYKVLDGATVPTPLLTAIGEKQHRVRFVTTVAPPVPTDGAVDLSVAAA